jgi:UDP:flavonoid glycosyltransferase YjiC (YdhE family)
MKFLFTVGGSAATVFAMSPLATAARNAGHEILLTVDEPLLEAVESIGLPAVATPHPGMPSARLAALLDLAGDWPPDLVVGGLSHIPGLLAAHRKALYVRHYWDIVPLRPEEGLQPELERLGLRAPPEADLFVDVCPPCLRPSLTPGARPMRWIPRNRQRRLEPWMYTRPKGRPRVLITSGSRIPLLRTAGDSMRPLLDELTRAGAEVLIAAPEGAAEKFGAELGDVRIGWIPLDVVAPTCDLAVHHGGAATAMTFMNAGVPQLITPENGYARTVAEAVSGFGAALTVLTERQEPDQDPAEVIAAGCREILSTPRYAERAQDLVKEIATLPTPAEVVQELESLAA